MTPRYDWRAHATFLDFLNRTRQPYKRARTEEFTAKPRDLFIPGWGDHGTGFESTREVERLIASMVKP